jgi:CelD/BcsL family acetyltransferase involved in cellulose biosynthesis
VFARVLAGFDEVPAGRWAQLLGCSPTRSVFLTRAWIEAWWDTLGEGTLLLVAAEDAGSTIALAPFFASGGVVSFLGTDSSDYLDFLGDVAECDVLDALLRTAQESTPGFAGFRLAVVPERSPTPALLEAAATRLGLEPTGDEPVPAPTLDRAGLVAATRKKSLVRHENWFRRNGELSVAHLTGSGAILAELERFFDQHVERCTIAPYASLFEDPRQRAFYRRLAERQGPEGWLRFTRLDWDGNTIAYHFGMSFEGSYLWYKPSFDVALARHSPGEVLLRQLLLAAHHEGAHTFDFGLGEEAFKYRFATAVPLVRTWNLRP